MSLYGMRIKGPIPDKFKRNICLCKTNMGLINSGGPTPWVTHVYCVCKSCKKPPSYMLYDCVGCGEVFLYDFYQNFCSKAPLCWDCNPDNKECEYHTYCVIKVTDEKRIPPLYKLKPAFTKEELEDFNFDFE